MSALVLFAMLSSCDSYPRDIAGTRDRVAKTQQIRVGYGDLPPDQRALATSFVARLADATGARAAPPEQGSNEALFAALDEGDLDLVLTEVATDSPWLAEVAVIEPLARRRLGKRELGLSAIARNGENRWVMVLEKQARELRGPS